MYRDSTRSMKGYLKTYRSGHNAKTIAKYLQLQTHHQYMYRKASKGNTVVHVGARNHQIRHGITTRLRRRCAMAAWVVPLASSSADLSIKQTRSDRGVARVVHAPPRNSSVDDLQPPSLLETPISGTPNRKIHTHTPNERRVPHAPPSPMGGGGVVGTGRLGFGRSTPSWCQISHVDAQRRWKTRLTSLGHSDTQH